MGTKQDEIVAGIAAAHAEFMEMIRGASAEQWKAAGVNHPQIQFGEDEHRPVGVIAHHVATAYTNTIARCEAWIRGEDPEPPTNDGNARHEAANPDPDRQATIALLDANAAKLSAFASGLTDDQLEKGGRFATGDQTVAGMLGTVIPFHIRWHAGSIRATWEQKALI